jgi:hypothetical protein
MFYGIYDVPTWALGGLFAVTFVGFTCLGKTQRGRISIDTNVIGFMN